MHTFTKIFASLNGFRTLVKANRFGCDTDFARDVHDKLIGKLDEAIASVASVLSTQRYTASDAFDKSWDAEGYLQAVEEDFINEFIECGDIPLVDYVLCSEPYTDWYWPKTEKWYYLSGS